MLYLKFKESLLKGYSFDLLNDNIKVALLTSAYVPGDNDEFFGDISDAEVVGNGYLAGGKTLEDKVLSSGADQVIFDASDVSWDIVGQISPSYAVIYKDTGDPATSRIICLKQFLSPRTTINDSITLEWNADGIFKLR